MLFATTTSAYFREPIPERLSGAHCKNWGHGTATGKGWLQLGVRGAKNKRATMKDYNERTPYHHPLPNRVALLRQDRGEEQPSNVGIHRHAHETVLTRYVELSPACAEAADSAPAKNTSSSRGSDFTNALTATLAFAFTNRKAAATSIVYSAVGRQHELMMTEIREYRDRYGRVLGIVAWIAWLALLRLLLCAGALASILASLIAVSAVTYGVVMLVAWLST